jgi:putative acetyltransferase
MPRTVSVTRESSGNVYRHSSGISLCCLSRILRSWNESTAVGPFTPFRIDSTIAAMEPQPAAPEVDVLIREANTADIESVVRLHHHVLETSLPYLPSHHTVEEGLAFFSGVFASCTVDIAEYRGVVVGYCAHRSGWIDHLYVHPEYQHRGIGSALLKQAMQARRALRLWTFQKNVPARAFYERYGFRLVDGTDGSRNEEREPDALYEWVAFR